MKNFISDEERNANFAAFEEARRIADGVPVSFDFVEKNQALTIEIDALKMKNELSLTRPVINKIHRVKTSAGLSKLPPDALLFLAERLIFEIYDKAIYAQEKVFKLALFAAGSRCPIATFSGRRLTGCGDGVKKRNNSLIMLICFLRESATEKTQLRAGTLTNPGNCADALTLYGQPAASAPTQASSSLRALQSLGYVIEHETGTKSAYFTVSDTIEELYKIFKDVKHSRHG